MYRIFTVIALLTVTGCQDSSGAEPAELPRNVILFIGDGMGAEHLKAARLAKEGELAIDDLPVQGLANTGSADSSVTDSAAAATALATGHKVNNGQIAMSPDGINLATLLERAEDAGKSTGLVTTTQISHATPAAFGAHAENRSMVLDISRQLLFRGIEVLFGGGEDYMIAAGETGCYPQPGKREDGRNLLNEAVALGYTYVCTAESLRDVSPFDVHQVLGLFADEGMVRPFAPTLAQLTEFSIRVLDGNSNGYFLMVEGGQIDWASHANRIDEAVDDTLSVDAAVAAARRLAGEDTLIILTADHETGGLTVSRSAQGGFELVGGFARPFYVKWETTGHTSTPVPVGAVGPLSGQLAGIYENTHIHDVISQGVAPLD